MGNYRPEIPELRKILAFNILDTLETAGFAETKQRRRVPPDPFDTKERVFTRDVTEDGRLQVKVFTTIVEDEVRNSGKDAIRVCATWLSSEDDRSRGVVAVSRVHRTGDIQAICERMLSRMREVWGRVKTLERCSCGSPKFKSKKGNMVCADLCWRRERRRGWQNMTRKKARDGKVSHWAAVRAE
tara:strand:+ start:517 stop:1071 length:555 start_codon:yes stop_codon:yes gene_type:complete